MAEKESSADLVQFAVYYRPRRREDIESVLEDKTNDRYVWRFVKAWAL